MRRITQGLVLLLVLGLSVGLMSCGGDDDDEDISGVFQGTITDNTGLSSNQAQLVLQQNGTVATGFFTPFPGTQVGTGNVNGAVSGDLVTLTATDFPAAIPGAGGCRFAFINATIDDDNISGNYVSSGCPALVSSGIFDFSRQD